MAFETQEYIDYINAHLGLLYFVGKKQKVFSADTDYKEFLNLDFQIKFKCREKFHENTGLLDEYLKTFSDVLTIDQISILDGFKKKIDGDFVILKCLASHAIFIHVKDNNIYIVEPLADRFEKFFPGFPALCNTTILPFRGKIIYDGFIKSNGFYFGKNITMDMNGNYKKAKKDKTIITTIK